MNIQWDLAEWTRDSSETNNNFFQLSFWVFGFWFFWSRVIQQFRRKHSPSLLAAFPILKQSLVQIHSHRSSKVTRLYTRFHGSDKQTFVPIPSMTWAATTTLHFYIWGACMSITQLKGHRISFMLQTSIIKSLLWNKTIYFPGHRRMLILAQHKRASLAVTILTVHCHNYHTSYNIDL